MPSARGDVKIEMSADDSKVVSAWLRMRTQGPKALADELDRAGQKGDQAGRKVHRSFRRVSDEANRAIGSFIGIGGAVASLATLAQVLRSELENVTRLQNLSGQTQLSFADAERRAAFALGEKGRDAELSISEVSEFIRNANTGVTPAALLTEFEAASSSRGKLSDKAALETVLRAATLRPDLDSENRKSLVTASLALQKGFGVTPAESLAGTQQALLAARTEDIGAFSRNLVPGIAQSRSFGGDQDDFRFLASLFIGVGQRSEDPSGRRTSTNTLKFLEQVTALARQRGIVDETGSTQEVIDKLLSGAPGSQAEKTRQELVGVFDANIEDVPRELQEIKKGILLSEAKTRVALQEILKDRDRDTAVWKEINTAQNKIVGLNQEAVVLVQKTVDGLRALPTQQAAESTRNFENAIQRLRIDDPGGVTGISSEQLRELLQRTGASSIESRIAGASGSIASIFANSPDDALKIQQRSIEFAKRRETEGNPFARLVILDDLLQHVPILGKLAERLTTTKLPFQKLLSLGGGDTKELDAVSDLISQQRGRIDGEKLNNTLSSLDVTLQEMNRINGDGKKGRPKVVREARTP